MDGRWGFVDRKGALVIKPAYDEALPLSGGLAAQARQRNTAGEWQRLQSIWYGTLRYGV